MKNKQIVHIPVKVEDELPKENCKVGIIINGEFDFAYFIRYNDQKNFIFDHHKSGLHHKQKDITHWLKPTDVFVFSPEELKQLLEDYTNEIITNAKVELAKDWIRKEETVNPKQLVSSITIKVNKNSIKDQLTKFLKQLEDESYSKI